jgi:hypothetical protein
MKDAFVNTFTHFLEAAHVQNFVMVSSVVVNRFPIIKSRDLDSVRTFQTLLVMTLIMQHPTTSPAEQV